MQLTLADGGIETDLIFHHGQTLPDFAAFALLGDQQGRDALRDYYRPYLQLAAAHGLPLVLETPTWRASPDWVARAGRPVADVRQLNADAVRLVDELRHESPPGGTVLVSGCVGPRADGEPGPAAMTPEQAQGYHSAQVEALAAAGADRVAALTIAYPAEGIGIVRAGREADVPTVISFTVETTGLLPDGTPLSDAIAQVDGATGQAAQSFMVNCAHPRHVVAALQDGGAWTQRISGVRANASTRSHQEMDDADDLDEGDPFAFAEELLGLRTLLPGLEVLGGCCGTDIRHITEVARAATRATVPGQLEDGPGSASGRVTAP
jgi:S-methylmethionine-dependent homocysteine/selenocysteine methylase